MSVEPETEENVIEEKVSPYFYRTPKAFCSHQQTPSSGVSNGPFAVYNGNILYFTHPLFLIYKKKGPKFVVQLIENAIKNMIEPVITHSGPSTLHVTINEQKSENRWVGHFLHYIPEKKCDQIEIIEDIIPLHDVDISIKCKSQPQSIYLVPQKIKLNYVLSDDIATLTIPYIKGHQMIEINY